MCSTYYYTYTGSYNNELPHTLITSHPIAGDYGHTPQPAELTIERGQERVCSNIIITDDIIVEEREEFLVLLMTQSTTFSAGVALIPENATIVIADNDGELSTKRPLNTCKLSITITIHYRCYCWLCYDQLHWCRGRGY